MEKRKDKKGRVLQLGESQRNDGRYAYKYTDTFGKPQFVYSWKLVATDKVPKGKRSCLSLREKKAEIIRDLNDGIDNKNKKMTLVQLYEKQNTSRANVKKGTRKGRNVLMTALKKDELGGRSIDTIKPSDAKEWALRMSKKYSFQTINNYKRSLVASFNIAIEDDCVRKNPFSFKLSDVIEDDTKEKEVLTNIQEEKLLSFARADNVYKYYCDSIIILLGTGLRISECLGITVNDVDFERRLIKVDHQLLKDKDGYYIETPKSESGVRYIPMSQNVCEAFRRLLSNREHAKSIIIDGYSDFVFINKKGYPMYSAPYNKSIKLLIKKYNKKRAENILPSVTPHNFRHTFCTNMANKGMTPNNLQYIMGHKNISMTLGYYTHGSYLSAQAEMERLAKAELQTVA
jgi:Site-specific recombinase XerD